MMLKVTFFVIGVWAEKNPDLLKRWLEAAPVSRIMAINYIFRSLSQKDAIEQIKKAEKKLSTIIPARGAEFLFSPYGEQNRQLMMAVSSINYDLIMWVVDTIDWQRPSPETLL